MRYSIPLLALACIALQGCANLTNYTKQVDLRQGAVSIDVKQRIVFSQQRKDSDKDLTIVCAEPSPDALTVIGASGGLSISNASGQTGNLSAALAEAGSSIGLRTQSIQLLRDAMYRLCEGYAGGAVTSTDFAAMQRRYQSTMMGLIAIEQLTGPVVATQALLKSGVTAQTGVSAGDAAVDNAQTRADAASEAVLHAQADFDAAQSKLNDVRADIKATGEKRRTETSKKTPDETAIDGFNERLASLKVDERAAANDVADKKRRLDAAEKKAQSASADVAAAKSRTSASASAGGELGAVARATQGSNEALATAVTKIVEEINRSYSKDGCLALVTELVKDPAAIKRLSSVDVANSDDEKSLKEAEALQGAAEKDVIGARADESFAKGKIESAKTPQEKNALVAEATYATGRAELSQRKLEAAAAHAKETRSNINDRTSAVNVLKTSLSVCQRILEKEEKK